jgi:hypothetical protein
MDKSRTVVVLVCLESGDNNGKFLFLLPFYDIPHCVQGAPAKADKLWTSLEQRTRMKVIHSLSPGHPLACIA